MGEGTDATGKTQAGPTGGLRLLQLAAFFSTFGRFTVTPRCS